MLQICLLYFFLSLCSVLHSACHGTHVETRKLLPGVSSLYSLCGSQKTELSLSGSVQELDSLGSVASALIYLTGPTYKYF